MTSTGVVVPESTPQSYELRKATEALTVRNASNIDISFLARKAYNVMLQLAQEEIEASGNDNLVTFETTLKDFETRVGHATPNGRDYLKSILRQLTTIQVEFDYVSKRPSKLNQAKSWGIASMVSEVYIDEDTATIRWSFPPELSKKMLDPNMYNLIDLRTLMLFTSHSALALYEICSRYFSKPTFRTFQDHWTGWSTLLSGSREPHKTFREFNKMLTRALAQVREVSLEHEITPHFTKVGKRIENLWFEITPIRQATLLDAAQPFAISAELERNLSQIGLSKEDISMLVAKYDEEYLLAQADYTQKRRKNPNKGEIASTTGFFLAACEKNYAKTPLRPREDVGIISGSHQSIIDVKAKEIPAASEETNAADSKLDGLKQQWRQAKLKDIRAGFQALSAAERKETGAALAAAIEENNPTAWAIYQKKGVAAPYVENVIVDLLFKQKYPADPTAEDLLMFSLEKQG